MPVIFSSDDGKIFEGERADERNTPFHMAIVETRRVPNTKTAHYADLACGHRVMIFGDLALAEGKALCIPCRDQPKSS